MADDDDLRLALMERDLARRREATALRETNVLVSVLDAMTAAPDAMAALSALMPTAARAIGAADAVMFLQQDATGRIVTLAASVPSLRDLAWDLGPGNAFLREARRLVDLHSGQWGAALPAAMGPLRGFVLAPVLQHADSATALAFLSHRAGGFSADDLRLARRIARIVAQALGAARLARRNEMLAGLIAGTTPPDTLEDTPLDVSFDAVNRAVGRLTQAQALVTRINNDMLRASSADIDAAINTALSQTGDFAGSDRTYVFRRTAVGRLSNTHEWTAPGIAPMIEMLKDLPEDMMEGWRPRLEADREIYVPDVVALPEDDPLKQVLISQNIKSLLVAPLAHDGRLLGFVGYDGVRTHRTFLPGEVFLIRSVANVIAAVLVRRETEAAMNRASAALTAERDRMRATLDAMPDLVLELDAEGSLRGHHARSAARELTETIAAASGQPLEAAFPQAAAAGLRAAMAAADRDGRTTGPVITTGGDESRRWHQISAAIRPGADRGYVLVLRDITEARAQQRLIDRLHEVARRTSNLVVVTDPFGRVEWANPAFEAQTGWPLAEATGRNLLRLLIAPETDRAALRDMLASLRAGRGARTDVLNRSRAGREYWTDVDIQPLRDVTGHLRGFMAVQADITLLKNAERRALEERATAMDSSRDGIAITDAMGRFVYVNPTQRAMFALPPDEDIRARHWPGLYAPETAKWLHQHALPSLDAAGGWRGEVLGHRHDGVPIEQELSLARNPDGGMVWIAHDITERRRNAAERTRMREQLHQAQRREMVGQLAAGLAHDFNNLLTVIAGSSTMIEGRSCLGDPTQTDAARITGAAARGAALVARMSDLGGRTRYHEACDLRTPLREAAHLLEAGLPQGLRLQVDLPDTPQTAWADPTDILQVVLNLVINSRDALAPGQNEITLAVGPAGALPGAPDLGRLRSGHPYLAILVADTGPGIDMATRMRVFEPYFTTKGSQGTGLGLAIVAGIVRDNDAALVLDSAPGEGTRTTIYWPVNAPQAASSATTPQPGTTRLDGLRVLVVDDAPDICEVLAAMLEGAGALAVGTRDPSEALAAIHEDPEGWDILITDHDMPGLQGGALALQARALRPHLPCILITALPERAGPDRAVFDAVLAKPVTAERLVAAVAAARARRCDLD